MKTRASLLAFSLFGIAGCAPVDAEVGAVPPSDGGADRDAVVPGDGAPRSPEGSIDSPGGAGRCDESAPLRLYYRNLRTEASSADINYIVKVENETGSALMLSTLEVRYYFTNELAPPTEIDVFYADTCCSNKRTDFVDSIVTALTTIPAKPSANAYLSVAFAPAAGVLPAGDAVQVEIAFHDTGYARTLTQSNDHSFSANASGTQTQWDRCPGSQCEARFTSCALTVHRDGQLVWGTPP
ncbi:MAG: cellulose binding domain-containing protein [Polyangiaceae bacterium]